MLRVLSEEIGPRIPGTAACTRAEQYVAERMRVIGMSNVHLEEVQLPDRWEPGEVTLELVSPETHRLSPVQMMWTGSAESSVVTLRRVSVDAPLDASVRGQLLVTERGPLNGNMSLRFRKVVEFFQRARAAGVRGVVLLWEGEAPPQRQRGRSGAPGEADADAGGAPRRRRTRRRWSAWWPRAR